MGQKEEDGYWAGRVVEELAEARVFVRAGSRKMSAADAQPQFAEGCAEVCDPDDSVAMVLKLY